MTTTHNVNLTTTSLEPFGLVVQPSHPCPIHAVDVALLREFLNAHALVVLRGFDSLSTEDLAEYGRTWGTLLEWDFGPVLELLVHDEAKNYIFTPGSVPFHWDGAFADHTPSIQLFQCLVAPKPETGGETLFSNTTRILHPLAPVERRFFDTVTVTYTTEKVAHYGGSITCPLVQSHPETGAPALRFAEPPDTETADLNPLDVDVIGLTTDKQDEVIERLRGLLRNDRFCYFHSWRDGDFVLADNHTLLHGRNPFEAHSARHIQRVHIL